jgi:nucleotide-binding universal stress UspA family protein
MTKLKRILVPVDYSEQSKKAVETAVELSEKYKSSQVEVIHVTSKPLEYLPLDHWIFGEDAESHQIDDSIVEAAQKAMDEFMESFDKSLKSKVEAHLEIGESSYETILKFAKDKKTDLIVMGTHGRTGAKHLMLGSVAERVVRLAPCSVYVVR